MPTRSNPTSRSVFSTRRHMALLFSTPVKLTASNLSGILLLIYSDEMRTDRQLQELTVPTLILPSAKNKRNQSASPLECDERRLRCPLQWRGSGMYEIARSHLSRPPIRNGQKETPLNPSIKNSTYLRTHHVALDCIAHQLGIALGAQGIHDPVLVKRNRPRRHVEDIADFLHDLAFGK
jgi:hypothetical protein